jgi:hypothetical protein
MNTIACTSHPQGREIAATIRRQIGTDAWLATSARDPRFWTNETGDVVFAFRFGSRYGLPKWCEITYRRASDDYGVIAYKIHRNGCKKTLNQPDEITGTYWAEWNGIHADMLGTFIRIANQMGELS